MKSIDTMAFSVRSPRPFARSFWERENKTVKFKIKITKKYRFKCGIVLKSLQSILPEILGLQ
jgi:hypothetical protein